MLRFADVTAAAERIAGRVLRTPALPSDAVSRATGAEVVLKLDNLQVDRRLQGARRGQSPGAADAMRSANAA